jgi:hypothetical protein
MLNDVLLFRSLVSRLISVKSSLPGPSLALSHPDSMPRVMEACQLTLWGSRGVAGDKSSRCVQPASTCQ